MAVPKIAINGFGRIGRIVTRIAKMRRHFDVVAINDLTDPEHLAYVFKYDSVHGVYPGEVRLDGDTMVIDNDPFQVLSEEILPNSPGAHWEWTMLLTAPASSCASMSCSITWTLEPDVSS